MTISDELLRTMWRNAGGSFYGPHVETGSMPEAKLLPFLRALITANGGRSEGCPACGGLRYVRSGMEPMQDCPVCRSRAPLTVQSGAQNIQAMPLEEAKARGIVVDGSQPIDIGTADA